ncbi:MAG: endolytic transglycosylase MltG [Syntrophomonadaceae bacterium]|nr:endolytic transglycosylase MltG [Syntrophomonadaceae bacterium]
MNTLGISKVKVILVFTFLVLLLLTGLSFWQFNRQLLAVDLGDSTMIEVMVTSNSNTSRIASQLAQKGLINSSDVFTWYCRIKGYDSQLQAGAYQFSKSQSIPEMVRALVEGRVKSKTITIPEGYDLRQIGELFVAQGICSSEEWKAAIVKDYDYKFLRDIPRRDNRLEGFLFPDTYQIRDEASPEELIEMMLTQFSKLWDDRFSAEAEKSGLTTYRVITLASMVEKEGRHDEERARIAGVIFNRLQIGMPLQIDATVLYSLGTHKDQVLLTDLEVDSPYNTYRNTGVPPGPIASPGASSIQAVLQPEKHDYYYYVTSEGGYHTFSRTFEEHLRAKNK